MLTDREWEKVRHILLEGGFFDFEARSKTLKAVRLVLDQMLDDEIEKLQERISIVFAPAPSKHGEVFPFTTSSSTESQTQGTVMVYLSLELERHNQEYVQSVVAHEFAHVLLHECSAPASLSIEREADEKVQLWGFRPAYREYPNQR